jgi:hypothetical protein
METVAGIETRQKHGVSIVKEPHRDGTKANNNNHPVTFITTGATEA